MTLSEQPHQATRVALLTGASSGIGEAIAHRLSEEEDLRLLLSGRDRVRLRRAARGTNGVVLPVDLAAPGGSERLARLALHTAGRVDLLVAAAGIGWCGPFDTMPIPSIDQVLSVDLTAAMRLVRQLLPQMIARRRGNIVLIGSMIGQAPLAYEAVYAAANAGLAAFAESLRFELTGSGVKVTQVALGPVDTAFFEHRGIPYQHTRPRPIPASRAANAVVRAMLRGRDEVSIPRWAGLPRRLRGASPGIYRRLVTRFS
ncbi:MAG TPA: SDR family NAD(P)-dependent oxidoreductase [Actinocrinis sp.]|uniref:SDR family NAD(P)-dependent oxidoreductase n=1 Tax=Actinocrinis sp. TaxID=1920516 RepID=UPI002D509029|nr:SDR family NAD(P)-dependent oxidoreductase [Actinocrinis sp.]HZU57340.1 SDR family NAD(P)-dependent oxidoreductase [Actinocrinis sp.]